MYRERDVMRIIRDLLSSLNTAITARERDIFLCRFSARSNLPSVIFCSDLYPAMSHNSSLRGKKQEGKKKKSVSFAPVSSNRSESSRLRSTRSLYRTFRNSSRIRSVNLSAGLIVGCLAESWRSKPVRISRCHWQYGSDVCVRDDGSENWWTIAESLTVDG